MVLKKESNINHTAEFLNFTDVFNDINTPGIFQAKSEDVGVSRVVILDGHSTLLVFDSSATDLFWEAHQEQGSYTYQADTENDGAVIIPHNFYFEFDIELANKTLTVAATFDGSGVSALTMAFNGVPLKSFIVALRKRLKNSFTSVLKPVGHTLSTDLGTSLMIPDSSKQDLGFKLATIGISVSTLKVIAENALPEEEGTVVQEIYDAPVISTKNEDILSSPPPMKKPSPVPPLGASAPKKKAGIPKPGGGSIPSPALPKPVSAAGPPSPSRTAQEKIPEVSTQSTAIPPPPSKRSRGKKKKKVVAKVARMQKLDDIDDLFGEESIEYDELLPSEMSKESRDVEPVSRHTNVSWFDRMLPNRSYSLVVKISAVEITKRKSVTSVVSGERATETTSSMEIKDEQAPVIVRPQFPGCMVVPAELSVDIQKDVRAEFYVTPLALGVQDAKVLFIQNGKTFHKLDLKTKVITNRISRMIAIIGVLSSVLPGIIAFIVGENPQTWLNTRFELFIPALVGMGYIPALASGVVLAGSSWLFSWYSKPKANQTSLAFPR